ncbi:hypothetical protein C2E25_06590 [Geothermobacter hydrogeniphilus]|uniref:Cytochrome c-552/DMSO reductase-like haem-binding domain-containing protein n=1 Tax=Geothermobacter hydrogeniphilus TaxID=1969733 RepID=A0A2K2HBD3_9BACT|nr:hypothetical protein C2E25_06590 [Geothermobacter hydrogeniphilus]
MICKISSTVKETSEQDLRRFPRFLIPLTLLGIAVLMLIVVGCRDPEGNRLYALHLAKAPTAADWERALPHPIIVRGGRVHKIDVFPDIDKDTVHTSTPSCHHGGAIPRPLTVDVRAFYTDSDLYLRLRWRDLTRDDAMQQWRFDGSRWTSNGLKEDGFGLMWQPPTDQRPFSCTLACHIEDFGVAGATFHATNKMKLEKAGPWLDLWNWKADRTGRLGFADDRWLDQKGMHGDLPGDLMRPNSRLASGQTETVGLFGDKDAPVYDGQGRIIGKEFRPAGSLAPGWMVERPIGHRADVRATAFWKNDHWTVILRRPLVTGDPHDVEFSPALTDGIAFGLSVMDNTLDEHYASRGSEWLILLPPSAAEAGNPE